MQSGKIGLVVGFGEGDGDGRGGGGGGFMHVMLKHVRLTGMVTMLVR